MRQTSMRGVFNDLAANRQERYNAAILFVVIPLTKAGRPARITKGQ